ncbi:MAG TPA: substrate-binding domain-containing protein [Bacteroidota bacterium]|nr:substrate-binding domain-containing protein [Bacteroidota bacterium]
MRILPGVLCALVLLAGCGGQEPGSTQLTKGSFRLGCDEAVLAVVDSEAGEFHRLYNDAQVVIDSGEARDIIARFAADSVRTIVTGRAFNAEERKALSDAKVSFQEYPFARTAVAVISHRDAPLTRMSVGELDTMFSGARTRWPGKSARMIELALSGVNASATEIFRTIVLKSGGYDRAARVFSSSSKLIDYVSTTQGALGIVALNWLKGNEDRVQVLALSSPAMRPDSTYAAGEFYSPAQAYVYLGYYPVTAPVIIYTREIERNVSVGFISFVTSVAGQKVVQNNGLVPATMPVRLVHLTSQQVQSE